jgi:hypothetical protein
MTTKRSTLATAWAEPVPDLATLNSMPTYLVHVKGALATPMWPSLAAYEVGEITKLDADTVRQLADEGWMPKDCYVREGDTFAFRASAVAWAFCFLVESKVHGLAVVEGDTLNIDLAERHAEAARVHGSLARLTPELRNAGFVLEVLKPGKLTDLGERHFTPALVVAALAWCKWIEEQHAQSESQQ